MQETFYQTEVLLNPYGDEDSHETVPPIVRRAIWVGMAVLLGVIMLFADRSRFSIAVAAYVNCLLYSIFAVHFAKKGTLSALIPLIFPLWLVVGTSLGIIYFSIFIPDGAYRTLSGESSYFAGGVKLQAVIFLFLSIYLGTMAWFLRNDTPMLQQPSMLTKYIGYSSMCILVPTFSLHILSLITNLPDFVEGWVLRLYYYFQSLLFVIGAVVTKLSKTVKIWICVFFGVTGLFYTLGNSRAWVLLPIVTFACGIFLFSELKNRTKVILLATIIFWIPWLLMVTNTIRYLGGGGGVYQDLGYRWQTLKDWKYAVGRESVGASFFGRMYFTAGNNIVAYCPSVYPYKRFVFSRYMQEATISTLPGPVIRVFLRTQSVVSKEGFNYTGGWLLRDYDMSVTETSAIPPSIIGHFWTLGGFVYVAIGGFAVALIHRFMAWVIQRAWMKNPDKGIFYFSVLFYCVLWGTNWDLINLWRHVIWHLVFAYFGFQIISPLLRTGYASMAEHFDNTTQVET